MMADVLPFAKPIEDKQEPHLSGEAFCGGCSHKWVAVAPVGTTHLDCPACGRLWGAFKNVVEPEVAWTCINCGEQLFFLTQSGAMCRRCGIVSSDWAN